MASADRLAALAAELRSALPVLERIDLLILRTLVYGDLDLDTGVNR